MVGHICWCGHLFPFPNNTLLNHVAELGLFLLPPYRRQGNGRTLLHFMLNWARQQPLEKITLQVFSTNSAARNLYRSAGFIEEGRLKDHLKQGPAYVDFIQMSYWL